MRTIELTCGSPFGRLLPSCISVLSFIVSILVDIRSLGSLGRSTPPLYRLIIKAPWDRGSPSSAPPAPHRMLHERRFFFLASKAIVFTLSCVYGRSLFTGYLTNVINPTNILTVPGHHGGSRRLGPTPEVARASRSRDGGDPNPTGVPVATCLEELRSIR